MTRFIVRWRQSDNNNSWDNQTVVDTGDQRSGSVVVRPLTNGVDYDIQVVQENPGPGANPSPIAKVRSSAAFETVDGFTNTGGAAADGTDGAQVGALTVSGVATPGVLVSVASNNVLYDVTYTAGGQVFTLGGKTQANNTRYDFANASPGVATVQASKSIFFPFPSPTPAWTAIDIAFRPGNKTVTITTT